MMTDGTDSAYLSATLRIICSVVGLGLDLPHSISTLWSSDLNHPPGIQVLDPPFWSLSSLLLFFASVMQSCKSVEKASAACVGEKLPVSWISLVDCADFESFLFENFLFQAWC